MMHNGPDSIERTRKAAALAHACAVSIEQAIKVARTAIGGTAVDAKLKGKPGRVFWRVKLITAEGPIKVYIDGRSGEILEAWSEETSTLPAYIT